MLEERQSEDQRSAPERQENNLFASAARAQMEAGSQLNLYGNDKERDVSRLGFPSCQIDNQSSKSSLDSLFKLAEKKDLQNQKELKPGLDRNKCGFLKGGCAEQNPFGKNEKESEKKSGKNKIQDHQNDDSDAEQDYDSDDWQDESEGGEPKDPFYDGDESEGGEPKDPYYGEDDESDEDDSSPFDQAENSQTSDTNTFSGDTSRMDQESSLSNRNQIPQYQGDAGNRGESQDDSAAEEREQNDENAEDDGDDMGGEFDHEQDHIIRNASAKAGEESRKINADRAALRQA